MPLHPQSPDHPSSPGPNTPGTPGFASTGQLRAWCAVLGGSGLRSTGSQAHSRVVDWLIDEFSACPGVRVTTDSDHVLGWSPIPAGDLLEAGSLVVNDAPVPVAGAVPYSAPTNAPRKGPLAYVPPTQVISESSVRGCIVVRDVRPPILPMAMFESSALHRSEDVSVAARGAKYERPFLAPLHEEILQAADAGAVGIVFAFDVDRDLVAGYFDPHAGTHYPIPAVFIGRHERDHVLEAASSTSSAAIAITAETKPVVSRNVYATLPGRSDRRIVIVSHTDGATWVQENGPAAMLALAHHFSNLPMAERPYTLEFALTSGHLHMSREGSYAYASRLDDDFDAGGVVLVVALEHLGAREVVPAGDGSLEVTGLGELLLWSVGPSPLLRREVVNAVQGRGLDGVLVAPGFGMARPGHVPEFGSFGGIGTYYHAHLIPTMALVSGPWSLWAPSFGEAALDFERLRSQTMAVADVLHALGANSPAEIAGDYLSDRERRADGAPGQVETLPPEVPQRSPSEQPEKATGPSGAHLTQPSS